MAKQVVVVKQPVRMVVRHCVMCRIHGAGVDLCWRGRPHVAALGDEQNCRWKAELAHPLDAPEGLQNLAPKDPPNRCKGA